MPRIALDELTFIGRGLQRPECVLCDATGALHVADWRGGVTVIQGAHQRAVLAREVLGAAREFIDLAEGLRPNGIALLPDGAYLIAHLGSTTGGVYRLDGAGRVTGALLTVANTPLPPTNYVHVDETGRVWVTVSTRHQPRDRAYRADIADGFVVLLDEDGARVVADGLGYTNECAVDPDGGHLYVNETFGRRLVRFPLDAQGMLGPMEVVTTFGAGTFPDGLTFDVQGGVWITSIVSNRVIRVAPDGEQTVYLEDADPEHLASVEAAFGAGTMGRPHLDQVRSRRLANISSLAFGGPEGRDAYLGCLLGESVAHFRAPVGGARPSHWPTPPQPRAPLPLTTP